MPENDKTEENTVSNKKIEEFSQRNTQTWKNVQKANEVIKSVTKKEEGNGQ